MYIYRDLTTLTFGSQGGWQRPRTGCRDRDVVHLVRVEPDLVLSALKHGSGKPLLNLKGYHDVDTRKRGQQKAEADLECSTCNGCLS
jgi:hypothetical protein